MTSFVGTRFNNLDEARQDAVFSRLANTSKLRKDIQNEQYNKLLHPIKIKAEEENLEQANVSNKKLNNQVIFRDFVSGQNISVNLSNENLERLNDHFGSADFSMNDEGSIVLNGEAQNFVSGWFGDIAYKRNFIGADIDGDGVLNDDEKTNLRSIYGSYGSFSFERSSVAINITEVNVNGVFGYIKTNDYIPGLSYEQKLQQRNRLSDTIEDELNKTLSLDKNLNGELSLEEIESRKQSIDFIKEVISNAQKIEPYPSADIDMSEYLKKLMEELKKMLEEMRLKQELEQSGANVFIGDISKLSDGQKELLKQRLSSISADSKQNNDLSDLASNIKGEIVANLSVDILV